MSHTVSSTGWTTSLSGKMRTSYNQIFVVKDKDSVVSDLIENYQKKLKNDSNKDKAEAQERKIELDDQKTKIAIQKQLLAPKG